MKSKNIKQGSIKNETCLEYDLDALIKRNLHNTIIELTRENTGIAIGANVKALNLDFQQVPRILRDKVDFNGYYN